MVLGTRLFASTCAQSDAIYELPYEGAKEMLLVDKVDSKDFLIELFSAIYDELPLPKKKR